MKERKILRNKVKSYIKTQMLAPVKETSRNILNNLRMNFDPKLVTFKIDPNTNDITYDFNDF